MDDLFDDITKILHIDELNEQQKIAVMRIYDREIKPYISLYKYDEILDIPLYIANILIERKIVKISMTKSIGRIIRHMIFGCLY